MRSLIHVSSFLLVIANLAMGQDGGFKTVDTAVKGKIERTTIVSDQPAYLGVSVTADPKGGTTIEAVQVDSPAAKAGIKVGDVVTGVDGMSATTVDAVRAALLSKSPGDEVKLSLRRDGKAIDSTVKAIAVSRPMRLATARVTVGMRTSERDDGILVDSTVPDGPAAKAGVRTGDLITKIDGLALTSGGRLTDVLAEKNPADTIVLSIQRNKKDLDIKVVLAEAAGPGGPGMRGRIGWDDRLPTYFRKDVYRLAIVGIEFADVKHNSGIAAKNWEEALFSTGTYKNRSVTGQQVYGSLNDYYREISCGKIRVEGKMIDWIELPKKRADYGAGTGAQSKGPLLTDALEAILKRDGAKALDGFDGIFFVHAGDRVQTTRGNVFWPHRATVTHQGKRYSYFIVPEGGGRMMSISVICHEFGHMLGLPDLYARPENPGSEGLGEWCAMSNQTGNGRPQHFSAWCKEQLGWLTPTVINPTVKQKLILAPIENSSKECFKVLVRPDGSEFFLLENRKKIGFDASLAAEGLLIWRVVRNKPILEEAHGVEGPMGPRAFAGLVPFPSRANDAFTPLTTPSSRSLMGGGLPVHINEIRKHPDGKISFSIGYEFH